MIGDLFSMAWSGFYGGSVGDLLFRWEQIGVFSYVLPFFILFALIFAVLSKVKMFDNRGINSVISLAVALMALQFEFVPRFFSEVFPRLGIGLAIILVILILIGLFTPEGKGENVIKWIFVGVGFVVAVVVLVSSGGAVGFYTGFWFQERWSDIVWILIGIGVVVLIFFGANKKKEPKMRLVQESV